MMGMSMEVDGPLLTELVTAYCSMAMPLGKLNSPSNLSPTHIYIYIYIYTCMYIYL